ncbi:MAG: class F sortase, partial [Thermomicrobium sp.]|nr:class F sortase [Thermomicrobium sp.]
SPTPATLVTATPTMTTSSVSIARVRIPALGVDAPVVVKGLDASRRMVAPDAPGEVAWYDFTALPGQGSNIVLAGHVDFAGVGPAVFWDLWRLRVGDVIELELSDGRVARYRVSGMETVEEARAPVDRIVGPSAAERLTLITCAGNYNPASGRYDQRLVVTARPLPSR